MNISPGQTLPHYYDSFNGQLSIDNPIILIILTIVLIFYYTIFSYLGVSPTATFPTPEGMAPTGVREMKIFEIIMWGLFIFLILINGLQYFFSLDINTTIKNIFSPVPEVDIDVKNRKTSQEKTVPEIMIEKQVFNIPDNRYTFKGAKALCAAYGAKLATYDNIDNAHKKGAEWCNYGWSDKQMIYYPTQKATFDSLQKIKGHENDCGRPGINGGFIKNPHARFGANCYGYKPEITPDERELLGTDTPAHPLTESEMRFNEKVKKFRDILPEILISPFNSNKWSQI